MFSSGVVIQGVISVTLAAVSSCPRSFQASTFFNDYTRLYIVTKRQPANLRRDEMGNVRVTARQRRRVLDSDWSEGVDSFLLLL